ncbi:hypothetical protein RHSIM_Rhsim10G0114300 [Rhododendron simsii]|uniref:Uncharacterized protein n=1 Tax=Rhododendron simsii TaxID=118357 RepID=A0A834GD60_RHOSS|nr:hypothetical protein RHSIM_Rhsim10G0114300 [Rhododendron simsii]
MGRFRRHCNTSQAMADFRSHYKILDNVATVLAPEDAVSANFFRVVMGINGINQMLGTSLGLHDIHHLYTISRTKDALMYYLKSRDSREKLVLELPDSARGMTTISLSSRGTSSLEMRMASHDIITPQVHVKDINRALAFNEQGTHLKCRARTAQVLLSYRASYGEFIDHCTCAADNLELLAPSSSTPVQGKSSRSYTPPLPDEPIRLAKEAFTLSLRGSRGIGRRASIQSDAPPGFSPEEVTDGHHDKRQRFDPTSTGIDLPKGSLTPRRSSAPVPIWGPRMSHGNHPREVESSPDKLLSSFMVNSAKVSKNESKTAYQLGYNEGINVPTESYKTQMLVIQDEIWAVAWAACLQNAGVVELSPLWTENDFPSTIATPNEEFAEDEEDSLDKELNVNISEQHNANAKQNDEATNPGQKEAGGEPNEESTTAVDNLFKLLLPLSRT